MTSVMNLDIFLTFLKDWFYENGIQALLLIVLGFIVYKFIRPVVSRIIRKAVSKDPNLTVEEEIRREETLIKIVSGTIKIATVLFVSLMILSEFGIDIAPLIAGAGVIGLALGFGGQYLVRDIITGLFIILENQYRVGDVVKIADIGGLVEDISLRATILRDLDGTVHHIPHGDVKTVSNMSKGFARVNINMDVAYSTKIDEVKNIINKVGSELAEDPDFKENIIDAPKFLRIDSFKDSSVSIKILGETKPLAQWEIAGEMRRRLKEAFDEEGIEIPFPQIVIHKEV